jgi:hypothetical protein
MSNYADKILRTNDSMKFISYISIKSNSIVSLMLFLMICRNFRELRTDSPISANSAVAASLNLKGGKNLSSLICYRNTSLTRPVSL